MTTPTTIGDQSAPLIPIVTGVTSEKVDKTVVDYIKYHREGRTGEPGQKGQEVKAEWLAECANMVNHYYDLATDFYLWGWGHCFHFGARAANESFEASLARQQYYLALKLNIKRGDNILDVGCGVGGPMRNIARFAECNVTGINNNAHQIKCGERISKMQGLEKQCKFVKGNFNTLPFEDNTFDGIFQIEATAHAADKRLVYGEIFRTLKPGQCFASYEWCLTNKHDPHNPKHVAAKKAIEEGDGLPGIATCDEVVEALRDVGFEILDAHDRALNSEIPWYEPLTPRYTPSHIQYTPIGRWFCCKALNLAESLHIMPKGSAGVYGFLDSAAIGLVAGGQEGTFTPMFFTLARKPLKA